MENIDNEITKAKNRPSTAENLNYIGDLYLKKGSRKRAVNYFYDAADRLSFSQKDKKIAIYKKIIKNSHSDNRAYEEIIGIFSRMGLVVEEISFLTKLARLYREKGEFTKVDLIFGRIKEIDPQNIIAEKYFDEKKQFPDAEKAFESDFAEEQKKALIESDDFRQSTAMENDEERALVEISDNKELQTKEKEIVFKVKDRADVGLFSATLEESFDEEIPSYKPEPKKSYKSFKSLKTFITLMSFKSYKRIYIYAGVFVLFIFVLGALLSMLKVDGVKEDKIERIWINNNTELKTSNYEINVTRISDELMNKSGILSAIDQDDIQNKQFYSVSIKAVSGCLPDKFISSPHAKMSLMGKDGLFRKVEVMKGLDNLNRTIYKSNSCYKEFGAVFLKLFVYHNKDSDYTGLSIKGLEKGFPVIIRWR